MMKLLPFMPLLTVAAIHCGFGDTSGKVANQALQTTLVDAPVEVLSPRLGVPELLEERRKHWAFQAVVPGAPPTVKRAAWVKTPIDAFILSTLEAKGLRPAPAADKRALLRRATFDLTGLPPTPL